MANEIGNITASLKLESAAFIRELNKASQATAKNTAAMQRNMADMSKQFSAVGSTLKSALVGFVSVASIRQIVSLSRAIIDMGDEIEAAATKLGISAESLQRLRFAAAQADVETAELDATMRKFQASLASGKIAAEGANIEEKFRNFIDQIARAPTEIEKMRIAQEGLGIRNFQVGILLAARGVEQFNKDISNAKVVSSQATAQLSLMDEQLREISNAVTAGFATGFAEAFIGKLETTEQQINAINLASKRMGEGVGGAVNFLIERTSAWAALLLRIGELLDSIGPKISIPGFMGGAPTETGQPLGNLADLRRMVGFEGIGKDVGAQFGGNEETTAAAAERAAAAKKALAEATRAANQAEAEGLRLTESLQSPLEQYGAKLKEIARLHEQKAISAETAGRAEQQALMGVVGTYIDGAAQITSTLAGAFGDNKAFAIANAVMSVAQGIASALALPFPLNWAQVAAVTAAGIAQINTIRSARPGSASNPSASGGKGRKADRASSSATTGGAAAAPAVAATPGQAVNITIHGDSFSGQGMRDFIEKLNDALGDGARLHVG